MGNPVTSGYKTTKPFTLHVDINNIVQGVKDWEKCISAVEIGIDKGLEELAERMEDKAREYLHMYGLGGSEIASSLDVQIVRDGVYLTCGTDYAIYVEYGTGLAGSETPHPWSEREEWYYNIGSTIRPAGWWFYPTTEDDPNPHKHMYNGQLYGWTRKGQPSRPFMYQTWLWGSRSATQIIRKNIRNELERTGLGK